MDSALQVCSMLEEKLMILFFYSSSRFKWVLSWPVTIPRERLWEGHSDQNVVWCWISIKSWIVRRSNYKHSCHKRQCISVLYLRLLKYSLDLNFINFGNCTMVYILLLYLQEKKPTLYLSLKNIISTECMVTESVC